jgi:hypothetical protein
MEIYSSECSLTCEKKGKKEFYSSECKCQTVGAAKLKLCCISRTLMLMHGMCVCVLMHSTCVCALRHSMCVCTLMVCTLMHSTYVCTLRHSMCVRACAAVQTDLHVQPLYLTASVAWLMSSYSMKQAPLRGSMTRCLTVPHAPNTWLTWSTVVCTHMYTYIVSNLFTF